jgi:hypothetical protein
MRDYKGGDQELKRHFDEFADGYYRSPMLILARCTDIVDTRIKQLEESTTKSATESANLARKVYFLNWVIAAATVVYTITQVANYFRK